MGSVEEQNLGMKPKIVKNGLKRELKFALESLCENSPPQNRLRVKKRVIVSDSIDNDIQEGSSNMVDSARDGRDANVGVKLKKVPLVFKELIKTGLLDGQNVWYRRTNEPYLSGLIRGDGILCYCGPCDGKQIVTPSRFELHAGSRNKRAADYIEIENGRTIRDILNVCKDSNLANVEANISDAIKLYPD